MRVSRHSRAEKPKRPSGFRRSGRTHTWPRRKLSCAPKLMPSLLKRGHDKKTRKGRMNDDVMQANLPGRNSSSISRLAEDPLLYAKASTRRIQNLLAESHSRVRHPF